MWWGELRSSEVKFKKKLQKQMRLKQRKDNWIEDGTIKYQCLGLKSSRLICI